MSSYQQQGPPFHTTCPTLASCFIMVSLSTVLAYNTHATISPPTHLTCVSIGATAGIGLATLHRLASIVRSSTFHILGRSATRFDAAQREQLESLDRGNKFVFWETEITLLAQLDATCKGIGAQEEKVDVLFLSAGMLPFNGPSCMCLLSLSLIFLPHVLWLILNFAIWQKLSRGLESSARLYHRLFFSCDLHARQACYEMIETDPWTCSLTPIPLLSHQTPQKT